MDVEAIVIWVDGNSHMQMPSAFIDLPGRTVDGRGLRKQMRVLHARGEGAVDHLRRLGKSTAPVRYPCQRRLRREVLAESDVLARPLDRFGAVLDHVGVEIGKVMIVMD